MNPSWAMALVSGGVMSAARRVVSASPRTSARIVRFVFMVGVYVRSRGRRVAALAAPFHHSRLGGAIGPWSNANDVQAPPEQPSPFCGALPKISPSRSLEAEPLARLEQALSSASRELSLHLEKERGAHIVQHRKKSRFMTLKVTSSAFQPGQAIPAKYTCEGADISPPLEWSDVPAVAKSLALICDDPDAPVGTWVHWVLYDLPVTATDLAE